MDVLKDKNFTSAQYISRYSPFPYYFNEKDSKYVRGKTSYLIDSSNYVDHKVAAGDTLASLALKYYGRPDYYWIIADFNRIVDPFITLFGSKYKTLKIPSLSDVSFKE